jgi:hypothetical protein
VHGDALFEVVRLAGVVTAIGAAEYVDKEGHAGMVQA